MVRNRRRSRKRHKQRYNDLLEYHKKLLKNLKRAKQLPQKLRESVGDTGDVKGREGWRVGM